MLPHDVAFAPNTHFLGGRWGGKAAESLLGAGGRRLCAKTHGCPILPWISLAIPAAPSWHRAAPAPLGAVWAPGGPPLGGVSEEVPPQC